MCGMHPVHDLEAVGTLAHTRTYVPHLVIHGQARVAAAIRVEWAGVGVDLPQPVGRVEHVHDEGSLRREGLDKTAFDN